MPALQIGRERAGEARGLVVGLLGPVVEACRQDMVAERHQRLGIEVQLLVGRVVGAVLHIHLFLVQEAGGLDAVAPADPVGQGIIVAGRFDAAVAGAVGGGVGAFLFGAAVIQVQILVFRHRQAEARTVGAPLRPGIAALEFVRVAVIGRAVEGQAQPVLDQRPGQVIAGLQRVRGGVVFLNGLAQGQAAGPPVGRFLGDDVDQAARGAGAVERGHRATDDLDTLDGGRRRQQQRLLARTEAVVIGVLRIAQRPAIDQEQDVGFAHAAHVDGGRSRQLAAAARLDGDARDRIQDFRDAAVGFALQLLGGDDRYRRRRVGHLLLIAGGADHDRRQLHGTGLGLAAGGCALDADIIIADEIIGKAGAAQQLRQCLARRVGALQPRAAQPLDARCLEEDFQPAAVGEGQQRRVHVLRRDVVGNRGLRDCDRLLLCQGVV